MTAAITSQQSAERRVRVAEGPGGELLTVTMTGRAASVLCLTMSGGAGSSAAAARSAGSSTAVSPAWAYLAAGSCPRASGTRGGRKSLPLGPPRSVRAGPGGHTPGTGRDHVITGKTGCGGSEPRTPDWPAPRLRWSRQPLLRSPVARARQGILDLMLEHFCGRCRSLLYEAASGATVPLKDMCGRCRTRLSDTARKAVKGSVIPAALATTIVAGAAPASAVAEPAGPPPAGTVDLQFPAGQATPPRLMPLADLVPFQDRGSDGQHLAEPEPTMDGPASLYAATATTSPKATRVRPPRNGGAAPTS